MYTGSLRKFFKLLNYFRVSGSVVSYRNQYLTVFITLYLLNYIRVKRVTCSKNRNLFLIIVYIILSIILKN